MGPKAEKAKAPKAEKAEKAPKEAKAPKASLQDMAAAIGVPMKQMKVSAADYYKRVDNADPESRALLIERMPSQLRAGWAKHQASKAPEAPVVRRVLKKKPTSVAEKPVVVAEKPEAPARKVVLQRLLPHVQDRIDDIIRKVSVEYTPEVWNKVAPAKRGTLYNALRGMEETGYEYQQGYNIPKFTMLPHVKKSYDLYNQRGDTTNRKAKQSLEAFKESAEPAVRRVLKKKPVMVAVPEAPPAPAMKIPMERQRKAFSDSMAPKIAMMPTDRVTWKMTDAQKAVRRAGLSQKEKKELDEWNADRAERIEKRKTRALGNLLNYWRDMGEGREKKNSAFRKGVIEDVNVALGYYPRSSIPEYAMKVYLRSDEGKRYLAQEEAKQASKEPAEPAVRRVMKKPVMVAEKSEAVAPAFKPYALDFKNKSPERLDLEHRISTAYNTIRRYRDPSFNDMYNLQQKKSRDQIMSDVDIINAAFPEEAIPDVLLKYWYKTPEGKRYLSEEAKQKASKAPKKK